MRVAFPIAVTIGAWMLAYQLFKLPTRESRFFRQVEGPRYFQDAWLPQHFEGNFKMPCKKVEHADCYVSNNRYSYSGMKFLYLLRDDSGYGLLVEDENRARSGALNTELTDTVYFEYRGRLDDPENFCNDAAVRKDGALLLFEAGSPEDFIRYHVGWGALFGILGLIALGWLWRRL